MSSLQDLLLLIVAVAGSGTMVGLIAWFHGRLRQLERGRHGEAEGAARDIEALRGEVAQLSERLDFTERMLAQARGEPRKLEP
jgi:hypothetical protein